MDTNKVSKTLITHLGGRENIIGAEACMTRLRVSVHDIKKVDMSAIEKTEGVMAALKNANPR